MRFKVENQRVVAAIHWALACLFLAGSVLSLHGGWLAHTYSERFQASVARAFETGEPQPWVDSGSNTNDLIIGSVWVIAAAMLIVMGIRAWNRRENPRELPRQR